MLEDLHYYPDTKVLVAGTLGRGAWKLYNADEYLPVFNPLTINGDQEFKPNTDEIRLVANQNILDTFGDPMWLHVFVNNTSQIPDYSIEFASLNGIVVNGLSGKDWIRIENVPASTSLTVNGGDDDDFITFELDDSARQMFNAGDPWVNGGEGADWIAVKPSAVTQIHVNGGNPSSPTTPADTLNLLTGGANLTVQESDTPGQGLALVSGFSPVPYFGIEDVIANGPFFPPDRFEENDSRAGATDLVAGSHTLIDLNVDHAGDDDWYKWIASDSGTLIVDSFFRNNWGNLNLALYNSAGGLLQSSTTQEDEEHIVWNAIDNQTYFIRVYGQNGATNPEYTLKVLWPFGVDEDSLEPNDSFAQAYDLGKGDQVRDNLTIHRDPGSEFNSDDDWYTWTATSLGSLNVDLLFAHSLGNLNLELYDASGTILDSSTSLTDNERVVGLGVPGRKFYVRVYGFIGATNPQYELAIDGADITPDVLEPNGSPDEAFNLEAGDVTITGLTIHQPGDEDWFRWIANQGSTLNIDLGFSHDIGDLDVELYDQDLRLLSLSNSSNDDEHILLTAEAGQTYFIKVFGYLDATNHDYSLELDWPPQLPRDEFEPNDSLRACALSRGRRSTVHRPDSPSGTRRRVPLQRRLVSLGRLAGRPVGRHDQLFACVR